MSGADWAARAGCRIERHDTLPSTNALALDRARSGDPGGLWITAGEQTAGRGRHGRSWTSPHGNLYMSRLVVAAPPPRRLTGLAFVAAVALHDAVAALLPAMAPERPVLKWPNDLMVGPSKLAGILVEVDQLASGYAAAVGMGLNLVDTFEGGAAASLAGLGATPSTGEAFDTVGASFEARLAEWADGAGFPAIREAWLARAMPAGTPTSVKAGAERIDGLFCGLDEDGALLVDQGTGRVRRITAGEVMAPTGLG